MNDINITKRFKQTKENMRKSRKDSEVTKNSKK